MKHGLANLEFVRMFREGCSSGDDGVRLVGQQLLSFIDGINPRGLHEVQVAVFHQGL